MVLLTHIIIALGSMVYAGYMLVSPSRTKFYINYGLVGATLASGTYLVFSTGTHLLSVCATGLVYLAVVVSLSVLAQRKFVR